MAQLSSGSYGHKCKRIADFYRVYWTIDYKPKGSRIRYPRVLSRDTDAAGARRFCKKWGCVSRGGKGMKCLCGHSLHTEPCEVCGCERVKMDDATQLDYALTRLRLCIVENDALAQYPSAVLRDDIRLALVELARLSVENARLSLDRRAAWANGQAMKVENDRLRQALEQIANHGDTEMKAARTLHYDMRGWAMVALLGEGAGDAGVGK